MHRPKHDPGNSALPRKSRAATFTVVIYNSEEYK
jgi:hypothetical protein